ncbi:alpha-1,2-fucosyltransferase [Proteiniphilum sp.]|uniref:alpha-1,2-fucosyltransferase n=1 Tax=Proteiniphilum sp. TaxID=1926877 RepID=UPI002B1EBA68|nr:alpha-1,2-fucosyltransferase [Proteiniphilum sp.]MEA4915956.1 alpha-1,2-fucosyltransferase [Proteiniphilum sp.]
MKVICDAPGQTCNRLWSYVATVAECVVKKKKMMILFYDYTIEDFPYFLHCPFIYFPLYQKWYLDRGNGWNKFKGLTWKATHSELMDKIYYTLGFFKGWHTRRDTRYLAAAKKEIIHIFTPKKEITEKASEFIDKIRETADIIVGVHVRRGDYKIWNNGHFFYELYQYADFMERIEKLFPHQKVSFFISSNEWFEINEFPGLSCYRFERNQPSAEILDLYTLSMCDYIIGPFSTYSRWASFIGEKPLCFLETVDQSFSIEDFSPIIDYFHFANGKEIADW